MRNELLERATQICEWTSDDSTGYENAITELGFLIDRAESKLELVELIRYEVQHLSLPYALYGRIYQRLESISEVDEFVANWYIGMTKLYGDPTEEEIQMLMSRFLRGS